MILLRLIFYVYIKHDWNTNVVNTLRYFWHGSMASMRYDWLNTHTAYAAPSIKMNADAFYSTIRPASDTFFPSFRSHWMASFYCIHNVDVSTSRNWSIDFCSTAFLSFCCETWNRKNLISLHEIQSENFSLAFYEWIASVASIKRWYSKQHPPRTMTQSREKLRKLQWT